MRSAVLGLAFLLIVPFVAAEPAAFDASSACRVAGAQVAALALDGCSVRHEGDLAFVSCEGVVCSFALHVVASIEGAPVGEHEVSTRTDDGVAVCSAMDVGLSTGTSCVATMTLAIEFPNPCRYVSLTTVGAANGALASASATTSFEVCLTESGADIVVDP